MMNRIIEISKKLPSFDYSILKTDEKLATLENEKKLDSILEDYQQEVGELFFYQQQILANHGDGVFQQWYESKGFTKTNVYRYINNFKFRSELEQSEKDVFLNVSTSLQNEMSKPSASSEINQKVFDGSITTHKEYKELERKNKELEETINQHKYQEDILREENQRLKNQKPEVIEKTITKIPDDYHRLRKDFTEKVNENYDLKDQIKQLTKTDNETQHQQLLKDNVLKFCTKVEVFMTEVGGLAWLTDYFEELDSYERNSYLKALDLIEGWALTVKSNINKEEI